MALVLALLALACMSYVSIGRTYAYLGMDCVPQQVCWVSGILFLQVWLNYKRQSTLGWNINQVLLDFSGGIFSLFQLCMEAFVKADMSAISGDPVKFGLGLVTVVFDVIFMVQHYSLYKVNNAKLLEEVPKARYTMVSPAQSGSRRSSQQDEQLLLASATTSVSEEGVAGTLLSTSNSLDIVSPQQSSQRMQV